MSARRNRKQYRLGAGVLRADLATDFGLGARTLQGPNPTIATPAAK
jgi:hypothetical protein